MILKQYSALPERERALFIFGYLFDDSYCMSVFKDDIRNFKIFSELSKGFQPYVGEMKSLALLSLWLSTET
jgi:hypothetical protein